MEIDKNIGKSNEMFVEGEVDEMTVSLHIFGPCMENRADHYPNSAFNISVKRCTVVLIKAKFVQQSTKLKNFREG